MTIKKNAIYFNLLSMSYMEAAVSRLLDAQAEEIRVLTEIGSTVEQITAFNEYIHQNLNSVIKLHLILMMRFNLFLIRAY